MIFKSAFKTYSNNNPLAVKLLAYIIVCSSLITILSTGSQLYIDYRFEKLAIDEGIKQIENTSLASIENSLWEINPDQITLQLQGLQKLRDVEYVSLKTPFNEHYFSGELPEKSVVKKTYQLKHIENNKSYELGSLSIVISLEKLYQRLWDKTILILLSQGIKTFLVSIFILSIFHHLVTQHLTNMALYARKLQLGKSVVPLILKRSAHNKKDELSNVVDSFNTMQENMRSDFDKRIKAEKELALLNTELEARVYERTQQLQSINNELSETLEDLRNTQDQLIQSQKMASLGNLVAGVAHEINTPIGIGYTAASYLALEAKQHTGSLSDIALESSEMICQNLERAASLVSAFKQVSVDQSTEKKRIFNLCSYTHEVLLSLKPKLRDSNLTVNIDCSKDIELLSYPGSFYQIFNNLILNSLIHAPKTPQQKIIVNIKARENSHESIMIDYTDDGIGLNDEWLNKVFEPFATSKRGQGCSGLGMHISYNIITQLLNGKISCIPCNTGAHFRIELNKKM